MTERVDSAADAVAAHQLADGGVVGIVAADTPKTAENRPKRPRPGTAGGGPGGQRGNRGGRPGRSGPPGNANAAKHGRYLTIGTMPGASYARKLAGAFRRALEAAVLDKHGEISLMAACSISSATRHEIRAVLLGRALRAKDVSLADRITLLRDISAASDSRDKAVRQLGIDRAAAASGNAWDRLKRLRVVDATAGPPAVGERDVDAADDSDDSDLADDDADGDGWTAAVVTAAPDRAEGVQRPAGCDATAADDMGAVAAAWNAARGPHGDGAGGVADGRDADGTADGRQDPARHAASIATVGPGRSPRPQNRMMPRR